MTNEQIEIAAMVSDPHDRIIAEKVFDGMTVGRWYTSSDLSGKIKVRESVTRSTLCDLTRANLIAKEKHGQDSIPVFKRVA